MATRTPADNGALTDEQVRQVAEALAGGGRAPRVALRESSSGLAAGTTGTVVRLNDPEQAAEFVVVRIGGDELPFTPSELRLVASRAGRPKSRGSAPDPSAESSTSAPATESTTRRGSRRAPARFSVHLSHDERGWTIEASRGARTLVKPTPVGAPVALRIAELLDNDDVAHLIAEIADGERAEAERRAAELRAQLAEVEAVIAGYEEK